MFRTFQTKRIRIDNFEKNIDKNKDIKKNLYFRQFRLNFYTKCRENISLLSIFFVIQNNN